jgi:GNAT superfamily N-acetyltransferase
LPEGVAFKLVDRENVGWVQDWRGASIVRSFERLLNRGDIGLYALVGGKVIHHNWVSLKLPGRAWAHAHDPVEVGDVLLHRGHTHKDHRRRGISAYSVMYAMKLLYEQYRHRGLDRVCSLVRVDNLPPQHLYEKLGFHKTRHLKWVRLLGSLFFYWIRDISPDVAVGSGSPGKLSVRFKIPDILWDSRMPMARAMSGWNQEVAP